MEGIGSPATRRWLGHGSRGRRPGVFGRYDQELGLQGLWGPLRPSPSHLSWDLDWDRPLLASELQQLGYFPGVPEALPENLSFGEAYQMVGRPLGLDCKWFVGMLRSMADYGKKADIADVMLHTELRRHLIGRMFIMTLQSRRALDFQRVRMNQCFPKLMFRSKELMRRI